MESYNNKGRFFTGVNSFGVAQRNKPALEKFNKLNYWNTAKSINTFEFSTLYYILNYHIVNFRVAQGENNFILLNYFVARWVKEKINAQLCFIKQDVKEAAN